MQTTLHDVGNEQSKPTTNTHAKSDRLLDYADTYPNTFIIFYVSDVVLHIDSDVAYLVRPNVRSRLASYFYLDNITPNGLPQLNGSILVEYKTLKHVVVSAADIEVGIIFHNAQMPMAIPIRVILEALEHHHHQQQKLKIYS